MRAATGHATHLPGSRNTLPFSRTTKMRASAYDVRRASHKNDHDPT
jgi:hypothetical protein